MFEMLGRKWRKLMYGSENYRRVKVTGKDIQKNILKIQTTMEWVQSDVKKITDRMAALDPKSENFAEEYNRLAVELKGKNELYSTLQKEQEQEYTTLKKMKDSKFIMAPKDGIIIGGLTFLGTFAIALERENPKALKLVSFILKLMPLHI